MPIYEQMLWTVDGFPKVLNGVSGFQPTFNETLREATKSFPSRSSVALLSRVGVRSVVVDSTRVGGTAWAGVTARPIAGLPVTRTQRGTLIVYRLR